MEMSPPFIISLPLAPVDQTIEPTRQHPPHTYIGSSARSMSPAPTATPLKTLFQITLTPQILVPKSRLHVLHVSTAEMDVSKTFGVVVIWYSDFIPRPACIDFCAIQI